jgi:hypothetical protein
MLKTILQISPEYLRKKINSHFWCYYFTYFSLKFRFISKNPMEWQGVWLANTSFPVLALMV